MKTALISSLFLILLTAGCAVCPSRPAVTIQPVYQHASLDQLLKRLSMSSSTVDTIKADFSASMADLKTGVTQSCSGILALAGPDKLRMRGSKAMLPTLFDLTDDGKQLTLYVPSEKTAYRAERGTDSARRGLAGVSFFTDIFFGDDEERGILHLLESSASQYTVYSVGTRERTARLLRKVYFDRENLLPVRYQYFDGEGALMCDVANGDFYIPVTGGRAVPRKIALEAPPGENRIALTLTNIKPNSRLNPALFTFTVPPGARVRPIEEYAR
jgi:outer membrane lipoprotein-sorting protein